MRDVLGPALDAALDADRAARPDRAAAAGAPRAGDECHHRTARGHARCCTPRWRIGLPAEVADVHRAATTSSSSTSRWWRRRWPRRRAAGVPGSALVTVVARNGVEVGVKLSGTGERVVHGPGGAPRPGAARAAATAPRTCSATSATRRSWRSTGWARWPSRRSPAVGARRSGSTAADSPAITARLRQIARGRASALMLGWTAARAAILGVDARAVVARAGSCRRSTPGSRTARPAIGQIGGGVTLPPLSAFEAAVRRSGRRRAGTRRVRLTSIAGVDAPARTSHADRVYGELRDRLLRGEMPLGQRLVEEQLAAEFETSRTPVREALRRLEGDGHLVRASSGGLRPSLPNVRSMSQVYEVRLVIEELCVRRAVGAGRPRAARGAARRLAHAARGGPGGRGGRARTSCTPTSPSTAASRRPRGNELATRVLREVNDRIRLDAHPRLHHRRPRPRRRSPSTSRSSTRSWPATPRRPRRSCARTCSAARSWCASGSAPRCRGWRSSRRS